MALIPKRRKEEWENPFAELERLQDEMNRLFDFSLARWPEKSQLEEQMWGPAIDVQEKEDSIIIKADVPGAKKDDIEVSVENDILIVKGEKEQEKEEKKKGFKRRERFYGKFYRELGLPLNVDKENIKANYKNGVLTLTLPKKEIEGQEGKKIEIE